MKLGSIILAAGSSRRMGSTNKLLVEINGSPLCAKVVEEVARLNLSQNIVVTGHEHERVEKAISPYIDSRFAFAHNSEHQKGMHSSIRAGLEKLSDCDAFFVCLADMPYFSRSMIDPVLSEAERCFQKGELRSKIIAPVYQQQKGHPVLIGREYAQEILRERDGDYGCSYLFKRHPESVLRVDGEDPSILKDIDTENDVMTFKNEYQIGEFDFYSYAHLLKKQEKEFTVATVIEVEGSSSAKVGSKAIFDDGGNNLYGWIGGGCVERFIGDESIEAINSRSPRSVWADLDDEVFGLGVVCGGKMKVFIDPMTRPERILFPDMGPFNDELEKLTRLYGIEAQWGEDHREVPTYEHFILELAKGIGRSRGRELKPLRELKNPSLTFAKQKKLRPSRVVIVGRGRITESLAFHFRLLDKKVMIAAPSLEKENYPRDIDFHQLKEGYAHIPFDREDVVIVASHSPRDPAIVVNALAKGATHVAMVGSQKRAREAWEFLEIDDDNVEDPLYIPAGLDLSCQNPAEIALSVVAEVVQREMEGGE